MFLAKDCGGTTIEHRTKHYTWKQDGAAVEVPDELGNALLAIRGGGFSVTEPPAASAKAAPAASKTAPAAQK